MTMHWSRAKTLGLSGNDWYANRLDLEEDKRVRWVGRYRAAKFGLIWILYYKPSDGAPEVEVDLSETLAKAKVYAERHARTSS